MGQNGFSAVGSLFSDKLLESYMSQFSAAQLDYFYAFPMWMVIAWAIATWGSLVASLGLLLRKSWAALLFGAAIAGMLISTIYNFVLTDGLEAMGTEGAIFTAVIWVIALLLFYYARAMARRGILK